MTTASSKPKPTRKASDAPAPAAEPAAAVVSKSRRLEVFRKPDETEDRAVAGMVGRGLVTNASTVLRFEQHEHGDLSLMDMARELRDQGQAVNRGDLSALERLLTAQALSLNAIFGELARIAQCNIYKVPEVADRYLRLALKAQSQSRATVETLATIKNPPVFARQMNVAHGPQQVNNGVALTSTPASTYPGETAFGQTELLEGLTHGRTQLDTRATATAGRAHQDLAAVETVNWPAQP